MAAQVVGQTGLLLYRKCTSSNISARLPIGGDRKRIVAELLDGVNSKRNYRQR